jgi:hypothetical protein
MRRFFSFWWSCVRTAAGGNSTFANDWQWVFGNPAVSAFGTLAIAALGGFAPTLFARLGVTEMTTGMPALDSFLGAFAAFLITWFAAFIFRLFYAPVTLFHQQKDRADKLEGIVPAPILSKRTKPIAVLRERYLTNKTPIQRQILDLEAEGLQAIVDMQIIFVSLAAETGELTKLMSKSNKKIRSENDAPKKRQAVKQLADHLNGYSDRVEEFTAIIRGMNPVLLECTGQYLEQAISKVDRVTLDKFVEAVESNVNGVAGARDSGRGSVETICSNFRGITYDLNNATSRLESVMGDLSDSFNEHISACEHLIALARGQGDGKTELA